VALREAFLDGPAGVALDTTNSGGPDQFDKVAAATTSTLAFSSDVLYEGATTLKLTPGTAGQVHADMTGYGQAASLSFRLPLQIAQLPTTGNMVLCRFANKNNGNHSRVSVTPSGQVILQYGTGNAIGATSTTVLTLNEFWRIEAQATSTGTGAAANSITARIYDPTGALVETITHNNFTVPATGIDAALLGQAGSVAQTATTWYAARWAVSDLGWIGPPTLDGGAVSITAPAALTVGGTVTAGGVSGAVTMAAPASLTVDGGDTELAAVAISAAAALTVAASVAEFAAVTMQAPAGLTVAGAIDRQGAVTLAIPASLAVAGIRGVAGAASLTFLAALSVPASVTESAAVALSVPVALTVDGLSGKTGAVALTVPAGLTVAGIRGLFAAVSLTAPARLTVAGALLASGAVQLQFPMDLLAAPLVPGFYLLNPCDWDLVDATAIDGTNAQDQFGMCNQWDIINTGLYVDKSTDRSALAFPGISSLHGKLAAQIANYLGWDMLNGAKQWLQCGEVWASWDMLLHAYPGDGRIRCVQLLDQAHNQRISVSFSTTGAPGIRNTSSGAVTSAAQKVALGTWYHYEFHAKITGTATATCDLDVYTAADMQLFASLSGVNLTSLTGTTAIGGLWVGAINSASATFDGWLMRNLQVSSVENPGVFNPREGFGCALVAA
jgi:hypothetical protein